MKTIFLSLALAVATLLPLTPAQAADGVVSGRITVSSGAGFSPLIALCHRACVEGGEPAAEVRADKFGNFSFTIGDSSDADAPAGTYLIRIRSYGEEPLLAQTYKNAYLRATGTGPFSLTTDADEALSFNVEAGDQSLFNLPLAKPLQMATFSIYSPFADDHVTPCATRVLRVQHDRVRNATEDTSYSAEWSGGDLVRSNSYRDFDAYRVGKTDVGHYIFWTLEIHDANRLPFYATSSTNKAKGRLAPTCRVD